MITTTNIKCEATSKKGAPCKAIARIGSHTCAMHRRWYWTPEEKAAEKAANKAHTEASRKQWEAMNR